jgi:hypothetical protein
VPLGLRQCALSSSKGELVGFDRLSPHKAAVLTATITIRRLGACFSIDDAAAGTAVPAACSGNMLDWQRQHSGGGRGPSAEADGGSAIAAGANIKHVFDSRKHSVVCQTFV